MVVLTVFCVWLGVNKQREAVQWVKDHGGYVTYDFQLDERELPGPDWLCELIGIDYFADVVWVIFDGTEFSGQPLRELTQLRWLYLNGAQALDFEPKIKGVTIYLDEGQQVTIPEELKDRVVLW